MRNVLGNLLHVRLRFMLGLDSADGFLLRYGNLRGKVHNHLDLPSKTTDRFLVQSLLIDLIFY